MSVIPVEDVFPSLKTVILANSEESDKLFSVQKVRDVQQVLSVDKKCDIGL